MNRIPSFKNILAVFFTGTLLSACGGGGDSGSSSGTTAPPPPATYTVSGSVSGLTANGLVLQNNAGNPVSVAANGTSFTFSNAISANTTYSVTVQTQPTGQTCAVANSSGTATANVTNVAVTCSTNAPTTVTVGGTVSGLSGTVVLQNNGGNALSLSANGAFTFSTAITSGSTYAVLVQTQPAGQTCTVGNGTGTANANVTSVAVTCAASGGGATTFTVGGNIADLTASGLVLRLNGANDLTIASGATSFSFPTALATGASYAVTIATQATGQPCQLLNGSGTIGSANVANLQLNCKFTIGGTIAVTGASLGARLVLQNNLGDNNAVTAGATSFQFATKQVAATVYNVSIQTQPTGQTCTLTQALGLLLPSNVTDVALSCVNSRTPTALNGAYTISAGGSAVRGVATFFSDGTYILGLHANDNTCTANNGNGLEYGVYNLTAGGVLTWVTAAVDTNGDCGIHNAVANGFTNGTGFTKNGTTGVITGTLIDGATSNPVTLTPVASTSGQLLGTWSGNKLGFIAYFSDGTAFLANTQALQNLTTLVSGIEDACLTGVVPVAAAGTYFANFSGSCSIPGPKPAVDTNGTQGLSGSGSTSVSYSVSGDTLTTTVGTQAPSTTTRVVVN